MVGVTKIGRGNAKYWIEAVAEGGEDYYAKPGEKPGIWMGELAAALGLDGEVDREAYFALLDGRHPVDGDILVQRPAPRVFVDASGKTRRKEPILGHDIRFSAPKSVSLLWAIGSDEVQAAVEQALEQAVRSALSHMEREACFVQRGKGGKVIENGDGFISMGFFHRSSRAGDPALHIHVVTANMTRARTDGRWLSLANPRRESPLLREAKPTGYVFQAVLREELHARLVEEGLGVDWGPVSNGYADIEGISRAAIDHFSRRRAEIVEEMQRLGVDSPAAAEIAAYRTRAAKDYGVDPDRQRVDWRSRAAEFGLTPQSIRTLLGRGRTRTPDPIRQVDLDSALASLEARRSHFDRRDLICAIAGRMRSGASARALTEAVEDLLADDRVVRVHRGEGLIGTSYYTTPRLLQMEQRVLEAARRGGDAGTGVADSRALAKALDRHHYLSDEQVELVRRITTGGERIVTVAARPGTGKTTALKAARDAWYWSNVRGLGVATARSASGELRDAGIPSTSINALLITCEEAKALGRRPLPRGAVIVMDESSTTSTPHFAALVQLIEECDGKLVCIGDTRQIGAVGPGGLYGRLTAASEPITLNQIRRQRDPLDRRIVELAHDGRGSDALDLLRVRDHLVIADTLEDSLDAMVLDWSDASRRGEDAVMIARRLRDVGELNARAREILLAEGRLGQSSVVVGGERFAVGDHLLTRVNNKLVSNRERWMVVGIDPSATHLKVERIGGDERTVVLSPRYLQRHSDSGEPAVQHAYAMTTYATQSKTFDSAFTLLDAGISREDFLVAVSRARGHTVAYGVAASTLLDADLGPATREVEDAAHDIRVGAERVAGEFSASEIAQRKRIEGMPESQLVARRETLREHRPAAPEADDRRVAIDKRIAEAKERLTATRAERRTADPGRASMLDQAERMSRRQVERLEAESRTLAPPSTSDTLASTTGENEWGAELRMIEDRLLDLRRRRVRAERIGPSTAVVEAIGPRPENPVRAAQWNKGLDIIVEYRQTRGIEDPEAPALGNAPHEPEARRSHRDTERALRRVQAALEHDATRGRELSR
jgi:conjugative relaxase-like TrwC/TraI family protein